MYLIIYFDKVNGKRDTIFLSLHLIKMEILYEDNHIIIVNKSPREIVQGDKTGDKPLWIW